MRSSGILMPISSLPSQYGIGTLGKAAYEFVDFLAECRQVYWQVLPIGPTGYGDSPYQSFSTFAGNPYFIDIDELIKSGYLTESDIQEANIKNDYDSIDYGNLYINKMALLKKCCQNIPEDSEDFRKYINENSFWIEDYALFMAIKEKNQMKSFFEWSDKLRFRNEEELRQVRIELRNEIHFWKTLQFIFHEQWMRFKLYANSKGIKLIGDIPIYVSPDSCELWMNPELFLTDDEGKPTFVAGCPPDDFSEEGQLWGNPLYDWDYHKNNGYKWWIKRLEHMGCFFDVVRIDHFRGFSGYYSIPLGNINAVHGEWKAGPGKDFISVIKQKFDRLPIIAENLGFLTEDVNELLEYSGFWGMKVLQFAFSSDSNNVYLPHNFNRECVAYTGTHDNETIRQWAESRSENELKYILKYLNVLTEKDIPRAIIRAAYSSVADIVIIPLQDWLELGAEARLNQPGTTGENWKWRVRKELLTKKLCEDIKEFTQLYGRAN